MRHKKKGIIGNRPNDTEHKTVTDYALKFFHTHEAKSIVKG